MLERERQPEQYQVPQFPTDIIIETSSMCNLKCLMCDRENTGRPVANMSLDLFKRIANEAAEYPGTSLYLQFLGEPFLNPQIITMIRYAKGLGISFVSLTTNGMLLDRKGLDQSLVDSGIDEVNVSVDGASKVVFETIRLGGRLQRVENNIKSLLAKRPEGGPKINIAFCRTRENQHEEELIKKKWIDSVDKITLKAGLDNDRRVIRQELIDPARERVPCPELWSVLVVYNNGEIGICCEDLYNSSGIKANVLNSSIHDIWTSPQYQKIRQNHTEGNYESPSMCAKCEYWRRADIGSSKNEIYLNFKGNK